jgi:hypothetical protein
MIEKQLLLKDLQKQLHETDNDQTKVIISNLIADILTDKYSVRIWD